MITVGGKRVDWRPGLTVMDLAKEAAGVPGASFASIEQASETGIAGKRLVPRMEWPDTRVDDGMKVGFIVIASGG